MEKARLSVCIATHNEEKNIVSCLKSVYDLANEIVLVDGESTDETVSIAKKFGPKVKVFKTGNKAMFHINKQLSLEKATGEWILQLDADEVVSAELRREIEDNLKFKIKNLKLPHPVAYWIPRLNYFLGAPLRKGGQYPDYTIRFYKNGVAHFPCKSVHEQVEIADSIQQTVDRENQKTANNLKFKTKNLKLNTSNGQENVGYLKSDLLHYPYPNFEAYLEKWARYSKLEAQLLSGEFRFSLWSFLEYFVIKPKAWFFWTYFRHKAFTDGVPGFVFSLFSALRFPLIYIFAYEQKKS